jgi:hypothetical protein
MRKAPPPSSSPDPIQWSKNRPCRNATSRAEVEASMVSTMLLVAMGASHNDAFAVRRNLRSGITPIWCSASFRSRHSLLSSHV